MKFKDCIVLNEKKIQLVDDDKKVIDDLLKKDEIDEDIGEDDTYTINHNNKMYSIVLFPDQGRGEEYDMYTWDIVDEEEHEIVENKNTFEEAYKYVKSIK